MDPELLFLDEVMAGLNPTEVASAMQMLQTINSSGITLFVIEHVMKAIMGISDGIVVLHFGKKIAEGDPSKVIENPQVIGHTLGSASRNAREASGRSGE